MQRQRDLSQTKEKDRATVKNLSETEISSMPDKEFKAIKKYSLNLRKW